VPLVLFVFLDARRSWRNVKGERSANRARFCRGMRDLANIHYPDADQIRVVMDNLAGRSRIQHSG
jgi:ribosomal protein L32E